jgi:hypothetical protein
MSWRAVGTWLARTAVRSLAAKAAPWVAVLVVGLLVERCTRDRYHERLGAAAQQLAAARDSSRLHARRADSLSRVFHVDTVRVTKTVTAWRTLTDTLVLSDTVPVPVEVVREVVATADSAITACTLALGTCSELTAALRRQVAGLTAERDAALTIARRAKPGALQRWGERVLYASAGYGACQLLGRD